MAQNLVEYILDIKTKAAEQGLDKVVDALEDVEKELKKTKKESEKASSSLEQFKKAGMQIGKVVAVMSAVAVAIGAAGKVAFDASKKVTDLVNELNDLSVRSGVSAKTIQGLRQAMISSGQSAEGLTEVLGAISGQFAQLSTEGSAVEKKFLSFGVAVRDTNGDLRSNNDILLDGIRLLQGITDSSDRSRAAVTLFGEAGAKLNQALASGDFEKFLSFTEKFGIDAGPQASKTAAQFQVVLSALGTVLDGTLQKFVKATDGQNRFIKGMIDLGGVLAFTGSLLESFSGEIEFLTNKFMQFIKLALKQTIAIMLGPFASSLHMIIGTLDFLGLEIANVEKVLKGLTGSIVNQLEPTSRLAEAIKKAKEDFNEYRNTIGDVNVSLGGFSSGSSNASVEVDNLAKSTKNATEEIRTFQDVVNDLLGKAGIKIINFDNLLADSEIFAKGISRILKFQVAPVLDDIYIGTLSKAFDLTVKLDERLNQINLFSIIGKDKGKFVDNLDSGLMKIANKFSIAFRGGIAKASIKLDKLMSKDFGKNIANKLGNSLGKLSSKFGSTIGTGLSSALSLGVSAVLKVIKIAEGLGQRGSTVGEIEKSVEEDIRARAKAIELGLQALPSILFQVLPKAFIELADRIIFGFQKGFAEFLNQAIQRFRAIFTKDGRQALAEGIKKGFKASFQEFLDRINILQGIVSKRSGGKYIPSARGGIKFTGADEGLAMLHRGEFVVPETGQMPQAVQRTMGMGGSGINITINASVVESNAVDELVRQIERRFQTFGSSTSPLFGGR
jgi:uncharacterized protein YoxC